VPCCRGTSPTPGTTRLNFPHGEIRLAAFGVVTLTSTWPSQWNQKCFKIVGWNKGENEFSLLR
jgi:hypothetical protein